MVTIIQTPLGPRAYVIVMAVPLEWKNMKIAQIAPLMAVVVIVERWFVGLTT